MSDEDKNFGDSLVVSFRKWWCYVHTWQQKWNVEFNPSKGKIMCFSTRRDPRKWEYVYSGQILEEVGSHPYLGVVLDNKMRWSPHIDEISSSANKVLWLIKRNLWNCLKSVKETAYMTLVTPKLQYACSAWDPYYQKDKAAPERVRVQRKAARFVTGNYDRAWRECCKIQSGPWFLKREMGGLFDSK